MKWLFTLFLMIPQSAWAAESSAHAEHLAPLLFSLIFILLAAIIGGDLAIRVKQPAVLGELIIGVVLGNLGLVGFSGFEWFKTDAMLEILAQIGVLILLFEVGLESTVSQMLKVGFSAFLVATLGVLAPFFLGWLVGLWLLPAANTYVHIFLGATLTATSVGITARVLKDLNRSQSPEARIILGAAVIDDVLGLIILAVVSGIIGAADLGGTLSYASVFGIFLKATLFLVGALFLGVYLSPKLFRWASKLRSRGVLLNFGLVFCFFLSWLANWVGLASIVGAFAAGLILEDSHYRNFVERGEHSLEKLIHPLSTFFVPIFFVLMGLRTDLSSFANLKTLGLAGAITVAAIIGKQLCSAGIFVKGIDRLSVGIGMVPRGEVGLIFANIGLKLTAGGERIVDPALYSAMVIMVIITTLITPPLLKWSLSRKGGGMSNPIEKPLS